MPKFEFSIDEVKLAAEAAERARWLLSLTPHDYNESRFRAQVLAELQERGSAARSTWDGPTAIREFQTPHEVSERFVITGVADSNPRPVERLALSVQVVDVAGLGRSAFVEMLAVNGDISWRNAFALPRVGNPPAESMVIDSLVAAAHKHSISSIVARPHRHGARWVEARAMEVYARYQFEETTLSHEGHKFTTMVLSTEDRNRLASCLRAVRRDYQSFVIDDAWVAGLVVVP